MPSSTSSTRYMTPVILLNLPKHTKRNTTTKLTIAQYTFSKKIVTKKSFITPKKSNQDGKHNPRDKNNQLKCA